MSRSSSPVSGKIGQGLNFDGGDDYVSVPHNSILNPSAITISFWANMETVISSNNTLIEKNPNTNKLRIRTVSNKYQLLTNAATNNLLANTTFSFGKWEHWVFSGDGSGLKLYRNGILDNSNSTAYTAGASSGILGIGGIAGGFFANKVKMDDVRIYNRALSATEIKNLYNAGAAKLGVSKTDPNDSLNQGLVGHWTMDGADTVWTSATAATTLDKSGNGNTGTLTNMSRSSSPVSGKIGQGLNFDGVDDYVVKTGISLTSTSGSISGWFNIKTIPTASNAYVMAGGLEASPNNDANQIYTGVYNNAGSVRANVVIRTGATTIYNHYGNTVLSTDRWYHVAYTHVDGSAPLLYIDGVLQTLTLVGGTLDNSKWWDDLVTPDFYIGARLTSGALSAFFNGTIDDVRIYNRALSATEIKQLYNLGTPNYEILQTT